MSEAKQKIVISNRFEKIRKYIESIPSRNENMGEAIYSARNTIYRSDESGIDLTIKSFKIPHLLNRVIYTFFRKSKARRSYEYATKLLEMGINTPQPIAYIETFSCGLLSHSYYVCSMIDSAQNVRHWETSPDSDKIIEGTARMMALLHRNHVWHRDFTPGNILYDKNWKFFLIDINRMQFDVTSRHKLMSNFSGIHDESPEEIGKLARKYAHLTGIDADSVAAEAIKLNHKFWVKRYRKWKFKDWLKGMHR